MPEISFGTLLVIWFVCAMIAVVIGPRRGHSPTESFLLGFLLGPIGVLIVIFSKGTYISHPPPP